MSDLSTWNMKVYSGLSKDVEQLMFHFVKTGSVRYEGFSRIWQEMNFSLVYCGLKTMEHKREFMEEAFELAVMYTSPPFDFQQRIGGLYLMYAFYFTQRHRPRLKVRLSLQHWKYMMEMATELKKQGHLDASYVLLKLRMEKAFCYVHSSKRFFFNTTSSLGNYDKWLAENRREIEHAFPESLLRKLHKTHQEYQLLKSQLGVEEDKNLNLVKESMAEVIANRFQELDDEDEDVRVTRIERITALKAKSFSFGTQLSKAKKTASGSSSSNPLSSGDELRRRKRKRPDPQQTTSSSVDTTADDEGATVEDLMPTLQKYYLSDSEDEKESRQKAAAVGKGTGTATKDKLASQSQTGPLQTKKRKSGQSPGRSSSYKQQPMRRERKRKWKLATDLGGVYAKTRIASRKRKQTMKTRKAKTKLTK